MHVAHEHARRIGGAAHWESESARFRSGELDTRGIISAIYTRVLASEQEVRAFAASTAKLRPGFSELVAACAQRGAPFVLASGGLRQYIEAVLAAHLPEDLRGQVRVIANEGVFGNAIGRYQLGAFFPDGYLAADGKLHLAPQASGYAAFRHYWTPALRSTVEFSAANSNPPAGTNAGINKSDRSQHVNPRCPQRRDDSHDRPDYHRQRWEGEASTGKL